jgi:glycosyltransferase involved in cell wall biosynthesis
LAVITHALQRALEGQFRGLSEVDTVIAPNGVDLERFINLPEPAAARAQLSLPPATTVVCTGHLYAGRGGDLFLSLAACFPSASFVWVGGRPEDVAAFQAKARRYKPPAGTETSTSPSHTSQSSSLTNITFTGFVPNQRLPLYQAAADILLMPYARQITGSSGGNSSDICSPMKLFEYLAAGRAILSADLPVLHEILTRENAQFAPPEDEIAWASALSRLLSDSALRQQLAAQAHRDVQQYSWRTREQHCLEGLLRITTSL